MKPLAVLFVLLAWAVAFGEAGATPLLSPFMTRSSVTYEGGYTLKLRVCGSVLCELQVEAPQLRLRVPKGNLTDVVDPAIGSAVLFVDMTVKKSSVIFIEIPYSDFDHKVYPGKKVYVVEIRDGVFRGVSVEERGVGR